MTAASAAAQGPSAWLALAGLLAGGAAVAGALPAAALDWQPRLAAAQPWRLLSAAWVHWSTLHLAANLVGTAAVALLGASARLPARAALAWLAAWPLTHAALLLRPELAHYGGLSGVLHAGVAVAAIWLLLARRGRAQAIGAAIALGLLAKLALERPWGPALVQADGWDIAVVPLAHAAGAAAGAATALLAWCAPGRGRCGVRA